MIILISSRNGSIMLSFMLCLFIISLPFCVTSSARTPALYVLGDSLVDSGNNNLLPTMARANYLPYGVNFVKKTTGRFTNAEYLGLPYSPPYLRIRDNLPLTGLNYASGSCGILPETGRSYGKCLNFEEQVGLFEETVKLLQQKYFKSPEELLDYLSKSIFIISIGSNDYINNYLGTSSFYTNKGYPPQQFAQLLVDKLSNQLQRLYKLGARKMVVFERGPIGCIPSITRKYEHKGQSCVEDMNQLVLLFNKLLPSKLKNLTSTLNASILVNGQAHSLAYDAIMNPSKHGLMDASNPCCSALLNGTSGCIPLLKPCNNADRHFFWDGYHQTEAVYSLVASRCITDSSVCVPFTLNKLLNM
ncbi:GDSL esterase/lipase [Melia azedarach]|uniref:GDSL esterase/lipase n=1 Tax=Melia azedarach TaxID=155640 RepID=A0ACC1X7X0_MELAZ|nr:GDSL esterase/lipase [Melia azedarach]